jgi:anti-sigma regulatory factor (Ser/Thr protein kinase)
MLNAFQHGNRSDPNKHVKIGYEINEETAVFSIADEGGVINPEFMNFVLWHREERHLTEFRDFYKFANIQKPKTNNGTGTTFMHNYMDEVSYFKSQEGGLVVRLKKHK